MTDSWLEAADRIRAENAANQAAESADIAMAETERIAVEARERAASRELDQAVAEATQNLFGFMEQRGMAAKELLEARGSDAHVLFGVEHDGGYYRSVYLDKDGLGMEDGYDGIAALHSEELRKATQGTATAHDAALYFAYYGRGRKDPDIVRGVVAWLTQQLDAIAAK